MEVPTKRPRAVQQDALAGVRRDRAGFDEAVKQAKAAGSAYPQDVVKEVLAALTLQGKSALADTWRML